MKEGSGQVGVEARADQATLAQWWFQFRGHRCPLARARLFEHYCGYARTLALQAHHASKKTGELDDLRQWAYVGLLEAIDRFDPARAVGFATFATSRIRGSIADGMGRSSELQGQLSIHARLRRERLQSLRAKAAGASALNVLSDVATGLAVGRLLDGTALYVEGTHTPCPSPTGYESVAWEQRRRRVAQALASLPDRLQVVIRLHYYHLVPFAQMAAVLGVSGARASQLHQKALQLLREQVCPNPNPWSE